MATATQIPGELDLVFYRGDYFSLPVHLVDPLSAPIILTGATILAQIRAKADATDVLATFDSSITDDLNGDLLLELQGDVTAELPKKGTWDLQVSISGRPITYLAGKVTVSKDVSRSE